MSGGAPKSIGGEYGAIRANVDIQELNTYLKSHVPSVAAPVQVQQFKFGQSNPTYFLTDSRYKLVLPQLVPFESNFSSAKRFVLRKKPAGQLLSSTAHQIEREYRILSALHRYNTSPTTKPEQIVHVPQPFVLCEDKSVIGTPFYIMEYLEGRIFTDTRMLELPPHDRRECWISAIRSLAALAALDPFQIGLDNFGPTTDYFPRQIKSLTRISVAQSQAIDVETGKATGNVPYFEEMVDWYQNNLPDERKTGLRIVHGDYKLDNIIFHPTDNRVIGILDWELCTLGSPLADLANLTQPWAIDARHIPKDSLITEFTVIKPFKNATKDVPIPLEDLEREYCRLTNQPYPIKEMVFARSWMLFRLAIISQGIAARYARRQASSEKAYIHPHFFPVVGRLAKSILEDDGVTIGAKPKL
ncbi:kinase-like domain-containing protein [Suillus clintonianus]|uniref:kinase-like domain-containing protein n=1 Tax=Suillus clintonianus TaxID=1904413 RepID=UPI001B86FBA8|nr:kinase-like domain-containing protein [Suillus clintonianus]KAG2153193.1 kinase-like domain-containing protein [Suillus clintonianus]